MTPSIPMQYPTGILAHAFCSKYTFRSTFGRTPLPNLTRLLWALERHHVAHESWHPRNARSVFYSSTPLWWSKRVIQEFQCMLFGWIVECSQTCFLFFRAPEVVRTEYSGSSNTLRDQWQLGNKNLLEYHTPTSCIALHHILWRKSPGVPLFHNWRHNP